MCVFSVFSLCIVSLPCGLVPWRASLGLCVSMRSALRCSPLLAARAWVLSLYFGTAGGVGFVSVGSVVLAGHHVVFCFLLLSFWGADMSEQICQILNWNVRGLNGAARRKVVFDLAGDTRCTIACLQETKLAVVNEQVVRETLGQRFASSFAFLPADVTRGGALLAVDDDHYCIAASEFRRFSVSAKLVSTVDNTEWWLSVVYGPQGDQEKLKFLRELRAVSAVVSDRWLVIGDFNLILHARDKSNSNLNRRLMSAFRDTVQDLELKELNLRGRKYTWSNDTTQMRIDQAFCSVEWDLMLPGCMLQALSSLVSDHAPLLLAGHCHIPTFRGFRFESFWPRILGFRETVEQAWQQPLTIQNPFLRLHTKLQRTSAKLRQWAKTRIGNTKLLMCAAKQLLGILDVVQEHKH